MVGKTGLALCALALASVGCNDQQAVGEERGGPMLQPLEVNIGSASGSSVRGTAVLQEVAGGVKIVVELQQAPPGQHGIHIHEKGDCSDPEAKSAGEHFAPQGHQHGLPGQKERHLGDMGNLTVQEDGRSRFEFVIQGASLAQNDPKSLLGRAIIVHAEADKGTQPSGDAGGRIACAVIKR